MHFRTCVKANARRRAVNVITSATRASDEQLAGYAALFAVRHSIAGMWDRPRSCAGMHYTRRLVPESEAVLAG